MAKTSVSVLEEHEFASADNSYFGVNLHMYRGNTGDTNGWTYGVINNAYAIGAMTVRDGREWTDCESSKGTYNFKYTDFIGNLNSKGMDLIMVTGFSNANYDNNSPPYSEDGIQGFANYSKAAFEKCPKKLLKYQEMFNEWWKYAAEHNNNNPPYAPNVYGLPEEYFEVAKVTYQTIKADYPNSVLLGEFQGRSYWNDALFEKGITDYIDAAAIHQYGSNYTTGQISEPEDEAIYTVLGKLRDDLDSHGATDKPIWVTETGYTTSTNKYGVSEYEQAIRLPRIFLNFISRGVKKVFWYDLLDDGGDGSDWDIAWHEYHYGLMRSKKNSMGGYSPKPSYVTFGVLTRAVDGKTFADKTVTDENIYRYRFVGSDGSETSVLYAANTPAEYTFSASAPVTVTDIMGKKSTVSPVNGKITLQLTDEVVYVDASF